MPRKPLRPCNYPGCPNLTEGGYCEEHKKLRDKEYNLYGRDSIAQSFYQSKEWKAVRKRQLQLHPFCEECLRKGMRTKATMVDHIVPIRGGGEKLSFSNLQSLCWPCHSRKSILEGSRFGGGK